MISGGGVRDQICRLTFNLVLKWWMDLMWEKQEVGKPGLSTAGGGGGGHVLLPLPVEIRLLVEGT